MGAVGRTAASIESRERAHLLIRLAAIALGATLVRLAGVGATSLAALILVLYLAAAVTFRYYPPLQQVPLVVPVLDVFAVTGLVFALPLALGPWILYAFAIGVAALRSGPIGAVAATALAVVGYDAALVARGEQARATDLWPVQALIAIGLVIAEIVWAMGRQDLDTLWSRIHARALSGLTRQREPDELLRALVPEMAGLAIPISVDPPLVIGVALEPIKDEDRATTTGAIHDLVGDAASLLGAAYERTRREAEIQALEATVRASAEINGERTQAGVLASTVVEAGRIATGRAAIVRPSEQTVVVGDLPGGALAELARDRRLPTVVGTNEAPLAAQTLGADTTVALVGISDG